MVRVLVVVGFEVREYRWWYLRFNHAGTGTAILIDCWQSLQLFEVGWKVVTVGGSVIACVL